MPHVGVPIASYTEPTAKVLEFEKGLELERADESPHVCKAK